MIRTCGDLNEDHFFGGSLAFVFFGIRPFHSLSHKQKRKELELRTVQLYNNSLDSERRLAKHVLGMLLRALNNVEHTFQLEQV